MNLILTEEAVEWFFSRAYCPFVDIDKARLICDMRLNGETLLSIGNRVGLCKDRVRQYIYKVQHTYDRRKKRRCGVMADRYISEKALIENIAKIEDLRTLSTKTIGEAISNTPTADVVEVVRCKDCKHRDEMCMCHHPRQEGILPLTYPLDFCSYGERKTYNAL